MAVARVTVPQTSRSPWPASQPRGRSEDSGSTAIDVLANDTDIDGATQISSISQPAEGTVAITGEGTGLSYTPDADYCNAPGDTPTDGFIYTIAGGDTATVAMTVTCTDEAAPPPPPLPAVAPPPPAPVPPPGPGVLPTCFGGERDDHRAGRPDHGRGNLRRRRDLRQRRR